MYGCVPFWHLNKCTDLFTFSIQAFIYLISESGKYEYSGFKTWTPSGRSHFLSSCSELDYISECLRAITLNKIAYVISRKITVRALQFHMSTQCVHFPASHGFKSAYCNGINTFNNLPSGLKIKL
jgi:hypothetical protein